MFMIKENRETPIYIQIQNLIKDNISKGKYAIDKPIPSSRQLSAELKINRMTVRKAMDGLISEGYLYVKKGIGTFVSKKINRSIEKISNFSDEIKLFGGNPTTRVTEFEVIPANNILASRLEIPLNSKIYKVSRVRYVDDVPVSYENICMLYDGFEGITKENFETSIFKYIENEYGDIILKGIQEYEAVSAIDTTAKILNINKGDPLMLIRLKTILNNNKPLAYSKNYYIGSKYKFSIEIK